MDLLSVFIVSFSLTVDLGIMSFVIPVKLTIMLFFSVCSIFE